MHLNLVGDSNGGDCLVERLHSRFFNVEALVKTLGTF